ncbi:hypothetical protein NDU88_006451 [Pleurodeles waltl]|uniref:Uncharacterized protein n=1 Tax=Pleurodeles waltl TaxID=8319 RepID=A0AAV7LSM9_PLEWA|nr:hypothetical protein NDU88_006451 [Pleurodeles waltl]
MHTRLRGSPRTREREAEEAPAPDQGGAQGSCAPDKEAGRGPAGERAAPVSDSRSRLQGASRLLPPFLSSGRPAGAWPGRGAVRAAHPTRRGRPQAPQLGCPGAPATTNRRSPTGGPRGSAQALRCRSSTRGSCGRILRSQGPAASLPQSPPFRHRYGSRDPRVLGVAPR